MADLELAAVSELSTAPAPPPSPPARRASAQRLGGSLRRGWRQLTSMRTALLLLALLALAAIPGGFIPQTNVDPSGVTSYQQRHPHLGALAQHLGLFDVFGSPWFAAIYLLLFVSLIGCLVPRIRMHTAALRRRPPRAPRRLLVLPTSTSWATDQPASEVAAAAAEALRAKRWRVDLATEPEDGSVAVAAEKGYLRETGNLVFHVALLLLLAGVAVSGLFGYKGQVLVTQGAGFANSAESYSSFSPPRLGSDSLPPFSFHLNRFRVTYTGSGEPSSFDAYIGYRNSPAALTRPFDVRVNHPLHVDGDNVYLIDDGYAVNLTVRGSDGRVAASGATPFLSDTGTTDLSMSHGVVKVPDLRTRSGHGQLGITGELFADFNDATGTSTSSVARNPVLDFVVYRGNLGLDTGIPQNDFALDTNRLTEVGQKFLQPGQSWRLPDGARVTFNGVTPYAVFQVAHDPGKLPVLIAAVLILLGLTVSLRIRRRRFWLRAKADDEGATPRRTVVEVAGLARSDAEGFAAEFQSLAADCGLQEATPS